MEAKYYTPTIDEFHIGFEYEVLIAKNQNLWGKAKLLPDNIEVNFDRIINAIETIRVKCLDKDDIESLGWKFSGLAQQWCINEIHTPTTQQNGQWLIPHGDNGKYQIIDSRGVNHFVMFLGTIKNKSELSKLMKQLNIIK